MQILFCDFGSFTYNDILETFKSRHIKCKSFFYHFINKYEDVFFSVRLAKELNDNNYDFVFSVNFFPVIAKVCAANNIKYISWSYDSPLEQGLSDHFSTGDNYIFLFDRIEAERYRKLGYQNVFHMSLAANTKRAKQYLNTVDKYSEITSKYVCDVSFVGSIYESSLDTLLFGADEYTIGYIESIIQSQLRVYGANFVEDVLPQSILDNLNMNYKKLGQNKLELNKKGLAYAIESRITQLERSFLISELGELCKVNLYTMKPYDFGDNVKNMGPVGYFDKMLMAFKYGKINLNPTLKSIQSGISLRALDIMACGGVLLSNYQIELAEYFEDGTDVIMYSSIEDAIEKALFYLDNVNLREKISINGQKKVSEQFTYEDKINQILGLSNVS